MHEQGAGLAILSASLALTSCMTVGSGEREGRLSAAGFTRLEADTPGKVAKLHSLPQDTLVYAQRKMGSVYIYADAAGCGCAFVGTPAAYQRYQQIRVADNIAQMQETAALLNAEAAADWGGAWGPLVPGWC